MIALSSSAYEASHQFKTAGGVVNRLLGYNSGPAQFIQLHNSKETPANGAVPLIVVTVPEESNFCFDFDAFPFPCSTGIFVCNSSTGPTKTIGAADCFFTAQIS